MELYEEILAEILRQGDRANTMEGICYQTLKKIKAVLEDDGLEDELCFWRVEKLVCLFEEIGSDGGTRHDF